MNINGSSTEGLFAAGDIVRSLDQISVAMGEAAIAATAIHNRLRSIAAPRAFGDDTLSFSPQNLATRNIQPRRRCLFPARLGSGLN